MKDENNDYLYLSSSLFFFLASLLLFSSDFRSPQFLLLVILYSMILPPCFSTFIPFLLLLFFSFSQLSLIFLLRFILISSLLSLLHRTFPPSLFTLLLFSPSFICFIQANSSFTPLTPPCPLFPSPNSLRFSSSFSCSFSPTTLSFFPHFSILLSLFHPPSLFFLSLISTPPPSLFFFLCSSFSVLSSLEVLSAVCCMIWQNNLGKCM